MGALAKFDWDAAFDEYLLVHKPKGMPQYDFAKLKDVSATHLSMRFNEIERERTMHSVKTLMPKVMKLGLEKAQAALEAEPDLSPASERSGIGIEFQAKLGLETYKAIADREGMSPAAVTLNIQQNNNNKTIVAPLFESAPESIDAVFTVEHDVYPDKENKNGAE